MLSFHTTAIRIMRVSKPFKEFVLAELSFGSTLLHVPQIIQSSFDCSEIDRGLLRYRWQGCWIMNACCFFCKFKHSGMCTFLKNEEQKKNKAQLVCCMRRWAPQLQQFPFNNVFNQTYLFPWRFMYEPHLLSLYVGIKKVKALRRLIPSL